MSSANGSLFPLSGPFGIVMLEAMACGTPVVALRGGAVSELVEDGVTGYICDEVDDLPALIEKAERIDPHACRNRAMSEFDISKMVDGYERLFLETVEAGIYR
jgi:glycosyltransferase involved in cell wall biosynthesis